MTENPTNEHDNIPTIPLEQIVEMGKNIPNKTVKEPKIDWDKLTGDLAAGVYDEHHAKDEELLQKQSVIDRENDPDVGKPRDTPRRPENIGSREDWLEGGKQPTQSPRGR